MKKIILFMLSLIMFTSCSDHDFETITQAQIKEKLYSEAFVETFGTIAENQTWGFDMTPVAMTRSAYPNSNLWESEGYAVPSNVTQAEVERVLEVFNQVGAESYQSLVDWDCFFVQQVWKGTASYTASNGGTVVGGNQMDWLCAYDPIGHKETVYGRPEYNYQPAIITVYDDHVFNFNNSNGSIQLMVNSSTSRFGYKSSTDNGHVFYYFRMEVIDGNYYVGFDFSAEGQNPNEQVQRDYIYNDWIVKIVPGTGVSDRVKEEGMIICEDLGNIGDFDFNDVVFYAKVWESGKVDLDIYAAGGTLDISVGGVNVGEVMGKMVNTGLHTVPTYSTVLPMGSYYRLIDIPVVISSTDAAGNVTSYELTTVMGGAPQKICVPLGFRWCKEYKSLAEAYPGFKDWTSGDASTWCGSFKEELVMPSY